MLNVARYAPAVAWTVALAACAAPLGNPAVPPQGSATAEPGPDIDFHGPAAENFLATARVVRVVELGEGVTRPRRVTLELDSVEHDAVFKWIDETRQGITTFADGSVDTDFWDSWQSEVAAYRIDQLIELHMVPAVVERQVRGQHGSLMWWADSAMSEQDRVERRLQAPDAQAWNDRIQMVRLYDELIANVDRHMNNLLITTDFDIRLIDHSRAFRTFSGLQEPDQLVRFSRTLLGQLERLTFDQLKTEVGRYLSDARIQRLLDRRDAILELVKVRVAASGESSVFYR